MKKLRLPLENINNFIVYIKNYMNRNCFKIATTIHGNIKTHGTCFVRRHTKCLTTSGN